MQQMKPTFIGSVLKVIACTPNRNPDPEAYRRGVIEPTRRLRQEGESLGENRPDDELARRTLRTLVEILEVKAVELEEQKEHLRELVETHDLQDVCAEILAELSGPRVVPTSSPSGVAAHF